MARKEKKYHYIYKTTNLKNGKYYIGMHSTNNLEDGYMGSGKRLRRSLIKYGKENFKSEILEFLPERKTLVEREKEIVNEELLKDTLSMNLKQGGEGGTINDEHRKNLKIGDKIKKLLLDNIVKNHLLGKINYNNFEGRKHTEDTKNKMRDVKIGMYVGEKNPSYGTCWITNGKENKKIKKEKINDYLCEGWYKGRKF